MSVRFDHLAIAAKDKQRSALFVSNLLGLPEPSSWGPWVSVRLDDGVHLDYAEPGIDFPGQHYALLVSDEVFDRALGSISRASGCPIFLCRRIEVAFDGASRRLRVELLSDAREVAVKLERELDLENGTGARSSACSHQRDPGLASADRFERRDVHRQH
jgi:hypothetical protein